MKIWRPHPKQEEALRRPEYEVLFGGARGPGKTEALIVSMMEHHAVPRYRGLVLRKDATDLADFADRASIFYAAEGGRKIGSPGSGSALFQFPGGAKIRMGHMKDDSWMKYLGQEYQKIGTEELTLIPDENTYVKILGSCRSTVEGIHPQVFATTNPGGPGHKWVKKRFVDPATPGTPFISPEFKSRKRIFIPALLEDNPTLQAMDPGYVEYLESLKSTDPKLYKAWRLGEWDVFEGQFFDTWQTRLPDGRGYHVIEPFAIPPYWKRFIAIDWGYWPGWFEALWIAITPDGEQSPFMPRRLYVYRQLSLQRTSPADAAKQIIELSAARRDPIKSIIVDPSMYNKRRGMILNEDAPSIVDQLVEAGIPNQLFRNGNNDRLNGWMQVRKYLSKAPDGLPWLQVFSTCARLIETLPYLIHDEKNAEDLDTEGDDHSADALRYGVMTRPFRAGGAVLSSRTNDPIEQYRRGTYEVDIHGQMPNLVGELIRKQLKGELRTGEDPMPLDYPGADS